MNAPVGFATSLCSHVIRLTRYMELKILIKINNVHYDNKIKNCLWRYVNLLHYRVVSLLHVSATYCGHLQGGVFRSKYYKEHQNLSRFNVLWPKYIWGLRRLECNKFTYFQMHCYLLAFVSSLQGHKLFKIQFWGFY